MGYQNQVYFSLHLVYLCIMISFLVTNMTQLFPRECLQYMFAQWKSQRNARCCCMGT